MQDQPCDVLVVEDHEVARAALARLLAANGCRVSAAEDGEEAWSMLQHGPAPRVILLDLMMPRRTGWELLQDIRREPKLAAVPVIILTGVPVPDERSAEAVMFLHKPYDLDLLIRIVRGYCAMPAADALPS